MTGDGAMPQIQMLSPSSRADLAADAIRGAILSGKLTPGQPLIERDLVTLLGVSKTPIREALKLLSRSGLITVVPFRGASVREVDRQLIDSVYEVRLLIEPAAIRNSVTNNSGQGWYTATCILKEAEEAAAARDYAGLSRCNRSFHRELYSQCGNPLIISILDDVQDMVSLISTHYWRQRPTWSNEASEHHAILDAVERGDRQSAAQLLESHVGASLTRIRDCIGADGQQAILDPTT